MPLLKSITIIICMIFLRLIPVFAEETIFPLFGNEINYGRGVYSAYTYKSSVCYDANGNAEVCFITQGGLFFAIDPLNGVTKFTQYVGGILSEALTTATNGKVYFKPYPLDVLKCYDPVTKTICECPGWYAPDSRSAQQMKASNDNKIFVATYESTGGKIYQYDIESQTTTDLGVMKQDAHYIQCLYITDDYIYAGVGVGADIQACIRYERSTGIKQEIFGQTGGSTYYDLVLANGKIFSVQNAYVIVHDKDTRQFYDKYNNSDNFISEASPLNQNLVYNIYQNSIYEYNIQTKEHKLICDNPIAQASSLRLTGLNWFKNTSNEWLLEFHTGFMGYIGYYNPLTDNVFVFDTDISDSGPNIQSMEISPQGIMYIGGYQTGVSAFDTKTEEFLYNIQHFHQSEGIGFLNGKTYFGTYTGAVVYRYDPDKSLNYLGYENDNLYQPNANPGMVYDIEYGQDRPFLLKSFGDKLYIGSMCGYAQLGGALTIYQENENQVPSAQVFKDIIKNQSITGIAYKSGKIYLSSTIRGGLGIEPSETQARIAVFNEKTKKVEKVVVPDVPIIGTSSKTIGEISFGPDGLLWACSELGGTVFAMNPETFEVVKYVRTNSGRDLEPLARPMYLRWGDDGYLYTTAGWNISVINPETLEFRTLVRDCSLMALDSDGNIYYAKGSEINKLPINQWERLQLIISRAKGYAEVDYESEGWNKLHQAISAGDDITIEMPEEIMVSASNDIAKALESLYYIKDTVENYICELDYSNQTLTVSGFMKTIGGEIFTIKAISPDGQPLYFGELNVNMDMSFSQTFRIDPLTIGQYSVYIYGKGFEKPLLRTIYSEKLPTMKMFDLNIDYLKSTVRIKGTLFSMADKRISIKALDSQNNIIHISEIEADCSGKYNYEFRVDLEDGGLYTIIVYSCAYKEQCVNTIQVKCPENQYLAESNINITDNKIIFNLKIISYHNISKNIMISIASYEAGGNYAGKLIGAKQQAVTLDKSKYSLLNIEMDLTENRIIKFFVWDKDLMPIMTVKEMNTQV